MPSQKRVKPLDGSACLNGTGHRPCLRPPTSPPSRQYCQRVLQATEIKQFAGPDILLTGNVALFAPPYPFTTGVSYA